MARKNTVWVVVVSVGIIAAALSARLPGSTAAAPPPGINHQVDDYPLSPTGGLITIARPEGATGNDVDAEWERRIATHVIVLRHTGLYAKVLQNESSELRKTKVFKDFNGDADGMLEWLRRNLSVRAIPGTTLIEVSVRPGEYDSDARAIVKDIVSQHINDGSERVFLEGQQASQTLKQLQLRYRLDSQETEARLLKLLGASAEDKATPELTLHTEAMKQDLAHVQTKLRDIQDRLEQIDARQNQRLAGEVQWMVFPEPARQSRGEPAKPKP